MGHLDFDKKIAKSQALVDLASRSNFDGKGSAPTLRKELSTIKIFDGVSNNDSDR